MSSDNILREVQSKDVTDSAVNAIIARQSCFMRSRLQCGRLSSNETRTFSKMHLKTQFMWFSFTFSFCRKTTFYWIRREATSAIVYPKARARLVDHHQSLPLRLITPREINLKSRFSSLPTTALWLQESHSGRAINGQRQPPLYLRHKRSQSQGLRNLCKFMSL